MAGVSRSEKTFTAKQGQYLAYIHLYTRLHRRPPAETDMQEYFRVSPPSVHQMVLTLERAGFIRRQPRTPAASNCSWISSSCPTYSDQGFNQSKSPCRGTRSAFPWFESYQAASASL
jgi:SOS-response transcriptional repressor LexA